MDCHQEWVCDGFKVSAVDLAALVADDVSKRMETLLHDRFLESVEHRLVEIMQDLLPKFVSLQGEADSLRSKAGRSDSISSLPNPMQRAANPDMQKRCQSRDAKECNSAYAGNCLDWFDSRKCCSQLAPPWSEHVWSAEGSGKSEHVVGTRLTRAAKANVWRYDK